MNTKTPSTVSKRSSTTADPVVRDPKRFVEIPPSNGIIDHFVTPQMLPTLPWELSIEERQRISKDPRIMKQMSDIDRWDNTPLKCIWQRMRQFATAKNDWLMTGDEVAAWLKFEGIQSEMVVDRLLDIFYPKESGTMMAIAETTANGIASPSSPVTSGTTLVSPPTTASKQSGQASSQQVKNRAEIRREDHRKKQYNGIILCKYLELGVTTRPYSDLFIQHCFDQFDRPLGSVRLSKDLILRSTIKAPQVKKKKGQSPVEGQRSTSNTPPRTSTPRRGKSKGPVKMGSGATYQMIEPLKLLIERGEFDVSTKSRLPPLSVPKQEDKGMPLAVGHSPHFAHETLQSMNKQYSTTTPIVGDNADGELPPNARPIGPDDITFEMFRSAFLDPRNSEWAATFTLPLLECSLKYFCAPAGELPLVSLKWLKEISAVPVSEVQYDADAALLKEIEDLGHDPWAQPKKKRGGRKAKA
eukprot:GILI01018217.1.p1 GENE.GILI01018217.1~~GILI01018217.1.p1  ORF type:complete len:477 (-),score=54.10 GILI01018217.1:52-1461(-)